MDVAYFKKLAKCPNIFTDFLSKYSPTKKQTLTKSSKANCLLELITF